MKTKHILLFLFYSSLIYDCFGTAQYPDFLIYNGDTLALFSNPLEEYFYNHSRPDDIFERYGYNSTACWRGYIGYWELKNDSLFLIELRGEISSIDLCLLFKDRNCEGVLFADWVNGAMNNPYGKLISYEHSGYNSIYEFERDFIFEKGVLVRIDEFDNSKSKKSPYSQDSKLLIKYLKSNIDYSVLPETKDKVKVIVEISHVNKFGAIDSVKILKGHSEAYEKEALRVVKSIPEWNVLNKHGELYNLIWSIPVIFEKKRK